MATTINAAGGTAENSEMHRIQAALGIRVLPRPFCLLCGKTGRVLYLDLDDPVFGIQGSWSMRYCGICGLAWLDPQPAPNDIPKLYARYYTHKPAPVTRLARLRQAFLQCMLAKLGYRVDPSREILPRLLLRVPSIARTAALEVLTLGASEIGTLLDVGCGNGEFIARMRSLGWNVSGVEPDPAAVSFARSRGLEVFKGMISDVPEGTQYDVITVSHVIEHVVDPVNLLRECRKRLCPNKGRLIITTPNINSLGHRWFGRYWRGLEAPRHLVLLSPTAMRGCIARAGLRVHSLCTESRLAHMIYIASDSARQGWRNTGERSDFKVSTKITAYLFRVVEDLVMHLKKDAGEEVFCVCTAPTGE